MLFIEKLYSHEMGRVNFSFANFHTNTLKVAKKNYVSYKEIWGCSEIT